MINRVKLSYAPRCNLFRGGRFGGKCQRRSLFTFLEKKGDQRGRVGGSSFILLPFIFRPTSSSLFVIYTPITYNIDTSLIDIPFLHNLTHKYNASNLLTPRTINRSSWPQKSQPWTHCVLRSCHTLVQRNESKVLTRILFFCHLFFVENKTILLTLHIHLPHPFPVNQRHLIDKILAR